MGKNNEQLIVGKLNSSEQLRQKMKDATLKEIPKQYIAYGSNLNINQMKYRCPTATITGNSEIQDYELVFRGSQTGSYLTIEPKEGSTVPVVIWAVYPEDELSLDRYEGYPSFYGKEDMSVFVNGEEMCAMVYTMPTHHKLGMPSQNYVNVVTEGYVSAGFDVNILQNAIQNTYEKMEQELSESMKGDELPFQMRFD